jgi:hypothetical protein
VRVVQDEQVFGPAVGTRDRFDRAAFDRRQQRSPARVLENEQVEADVGVDDDEQVSCRGFSF